MNAKNDFSYVICGYKDELRRNPKARLATYCRSLGVNDDRVHHWMEKHGLTVRGLKDEVLSSPQGIGLFLIKATGSKNHRSCSAQA